MKELTKEDIAKLNKETEVMINKLKSLLSREAVIMEWQNLMKDEASRMHFLRLVTTVACMGETMHDGGHTTPEAMGSYHGAKNIIRFVCCNAVVYQVQEGKIKL